MFFLGNSVFRPSSVRLLLLALFLSAAAHAQRWTPIGPSGGTVLALAAVPNGSLTLWAGTEGGGIWRSGDGGESWTLSSEGLSFEENGDLKLSKVSGLTAAHGRLLAGAESAGVFESRDEGSTWSLLSTLDGLPASGRLEFYTRTDTVTVK